QNGNNIRQVVFWRQATSSTAANYTFTISPSGMASGVLVDYQGARQTASTPINAWASNAGNSSSLTSSTVTTTVANSMLAAFWDLDKSTTLTPTSLPARASSVASNGTTTALADGVQAAAGASSAQSATAGTSGNWIGTLFAIYPDTTAPSTATITS